MRKREVLIMWTEVPHFDIGERYCFKQLWRKHSEIVLGAGKEADYNTRPHIKLKAANEQPTK